MVSINRKIAELGNAIDSGANGDFLTVNDSGAGIFRDIQWTEIANRPNVLDSANVQSIIDSASAVIIGGAQASLDTLDELAAAINDDPNFYTTVTNLINALPDSSEVSSIISADVTATFVNNLSFDADTLDGQQGSYYLDYTNFTNVPNIGDSASVIAIIDSAYINALNFDADTLNSQQGTYYLDYTNFTNTPNVLDSADVSTLISTAVANTIGGAPASLDTLNELAAAIGDDANYYTTVTNQVNALPDSAQVSGIITADVDKTFVDALNVNAATLGGESGGYYLNYNNFTNIPNVLDSANVLAIADSAYITGIIDSSYVSNIVDSAYVNARVTTNSGFTKYKYIATAGQKTFSDSDVSGSILSYQTNGIMVWYNGILLVNGIDYTANNGTSVVLTDSAEVGDNLVVGKWAISSAGGVAGAYIENITTGIFQRNSAVNLDYVTIQTTGNAADFGDLSVVRTNAAAAADNTRALWAGGAVSGDVRTQLIDYIATTAIGNTATNFGDLTTGMGNWLSGVSDGTYALFGGGSVDTQSPAVDGVINYVTIQTTGNAAEFGYLSQARANTGAVANSTYGVWGGGYYTSPGTVNTIDYVTIATPGNATDFGDLTQIQERHSGAGNETYGLFMHGYEDRDGCDVIVIDTPGNATDFGNLIYSRFTGQSCADATYALSAGNYATISGEDKIEYVTIGLTGSSSAFGDLTSSASSGHAVGT